MNKTQILRTIYLSTLINNIKKNGFMWALKRILVQSTQDIVWVTLLLFIMPLHLLGFRQLLIRTEHIGHLAAEFDTLEKLKRLGLLPRYRYFVLASKKISNPHLLTYCEQYFTILTHPFLCGILSLLARHFFLRYDVSPFISSFFGTQEIYRINQLWDSRPPLLTLNDCDQEWSKSAFQALGIPEHQWFVCLHVREGKFWPQNELIQSHRNASITHTFLAIEEIVQRGGMVVRMGDPSMNPLPKMAGVIDYAHHPLKSERLDVVLCAKAKFFLGCTSGLAFVSMIFGVPVAQANMIPIEALAVGKNDISISKRLWCESSHRYLSLREVFSTPASGFYFSHQYQQAGIRVDENSPEDILGLTQEMLDRLEGIFVENEEDRRLHDEFMLLLKPGHYSYGAVSKVCLAFLKQYLS